MHGEHLPEEIHLTGFREFMRYDPESGLVVWVKKPTTRSPVKPGKEVGSFESNGYRQVHVYWSGERRGFMVHRICWYLFYGTWPELPIDHINRDKGNNQLSNLRLATPGLNGRNKNLLPNNTSGRRGVHWDKREGKWKGQVTLHNKQKHLGYFDDLDEAAEAVEDFYRELDGDEYRSPYE